MGRKYLKYLLVLSFTLSLASLPIKATAFYYNPSTGHWYKIVEGDWETAEEAAVELGGHLVTINDANEQEWLVSTFGGETYYWIGYTDKEKEGEWKWISGEDSDYTNWAPDEPNNEGNEDYAVMNWKQQYGKGLWNDLGKNSPAWWSIEYGIAEIPSVIPEPSTALLFLFSPLLLGRYWIRERKGLLRKNFILRK